MWEVVIALPENESLPNGGPYYGRLEHKGRSQWKTKRIAEKHCREFKGSHLRDAWVQEA